MLLYSLADFSFHVSGSKLTQEVSVNILLLEVQRHMYSFTLLLTPYLARNDPNREHGSKILDADSCPLVGIHTPSPSLAVSFWVRTDGHALFVFFGAKYSMLKVAN